MGSKTFKSSTAKQVLSQISRDLGPDAIILSHKKIQDSEGKCWVVAIASSHKKKVPHTRIPSGLQEKNTKFRTEKIFVLALVFIALIIAGISVWNPFPRSTAPNSNPKKLSVAVINFENQTGDYSYDYLNKVIPNLLITRLEQSDCFYVTSWERMHDLLRQIGKGDAEVIDRDLGFELCQRDGIDAIVTGSYSKAGDLFVTDLKVLDVATKRILTSASSKGEGEGSILRSQIDELSQKISQGMGFSESESEKISMRITDVTTSSLDAYYYFLRGKECYINEQVKDTKKFLEKAIELDPNFALAHLYLGRALWNLGEIASANEAHKKARSLSARATEKEKLYIQGYHALRIENDLEEGLRIFKEMAERYPKEKESHEGLALIYFCKKLFDQAIKEYNRALELDPYNARTLQALGWSYWWSGSYEKAIEYLERQIFVSQGDHGALRMLASVYLDMGRLDEALARYKEAVEVDPDFGMDWKISYVYALKQDYQEATRWIDQYIDNVSRPYSKIGGNLIKSLYQYWLGRLDESMINLLQQIKYADKSADKYPIASQHWRADASWLMGWIYFDRGEHELCRKQFKMWFDIYIHKLLKEQYFDLVARKAIWTAWYYFYLGLVDLRQGKIVTANTRLDKIKSLFPDIPPRFKNWISFHYDFLHAEILLAEGAVEKAIDVCEKSSPLGGTVESPLLILYNVPFLKDVLARAYCQNGETGKAIAEYERLVAFDPQREERHLIHPKYYYRLAELYEKINKEKEAIACYAKFLNLWRDADFNIPEVKEARKRLSSLQNKASRITFEQGY